MHLALGLGDLMVGVEQDGKLWRMWLAVMPDPFTLDVGEGCQDGLKPFLRAIGPIANLTKVG